MPENTTIDFAALTRGGTIKNLTGKERGRAARIELALDRLDGEQDHVIFKLPSDLYAITDSFLLGLLSESIEAAGGLDEFYAKYEFVGQPALKTQIMRSLERAAAPRHPLLRH